MRTLIFSTLAIMLTALGCSNYHQEHQAQAVERWQTVRAQMAVDLAKQQLQAGELEIAQQTAMSVLEIDPQSVDAQIILGRIHLEQDQLNLAHRYFQNCLAIDPNNAEALYNIGIIYERWGNSQHAFDSYLRAHNTAPENSAYVLALADMQARRDQPNQAIDLIDEYMLQAGPDVALLVAAGNILTAQGSHDQAVRRFRQALQVGGENNTISESLGYALLACDRTSAALAIFDRIEADTVAENQTPPDYSFVKGQCYLQLGQYHQAVRAFERTTRNEPDNSNAWLQLAQSHLASNNTVLARNAIRTAERLTPNNPDMLMLSGYIALKQSNYSNAITDFERVVTIDNNYALAHYLLGLSLQANGEPEQAAHSYRRAIAINPNDELAQQRLAALN